MTTKTENNRTGDFLLSEGNGSYSRENDILAGGSGKLQAGTVLGRVTTSKKLVPVAPAATDGSKDAVAILWEGADATAADVAVVTIARAAEVKAEALEWPAGITPTDKTTAIAQLDELGVVLR